MDKKIKVLIEANKLWSGDHDGIHRYVKELLAAMAKLSRDDHEAWRIDVFRGAGYSFSIRNINALSDGQGVNATSSQRRDGFGSTRPVSRRGAFIPGLIRDHSPPQLIDGLRRLKNGLSVFLLNRHPSLKFDNYDVVHMTLPQSYAHFSNCRAAMVTTVHDLTHLHFPRFHLPENVQRAKRGMDLAIAKNSRIIAVSRATRNDLLCNYPTIKAGNIHVVHEACDHKVFRPVDNSEILRFARLKYKIPEGPFILSLSTVEPRKNLANAIKSFLGLVDAQPDLSLNFVIAGKKGWDHAGLFDTGAFRSDRIFFIGFVDDDDLPALYSAALVFSYLSYYEGFGLPLLEAMSCGTPVVYGNNSSMPEVVGDGGLPADPHDVEDIKQKYRMIVFDQALRDRIANSALIRSRSFSWEQAARQTLDIYKDIAKATG